MAKIWSKFWKSSKNPTKQRKFKLNAPMHIKGRFLNVHLSKELRQKYKTRNIRVRKEDKVKVMKGKYKGKEGKIEKVSVKLTRVYITGLETAKKEGAKSMIPFNPSNLMIIELNTTDKKRKKILGKITEAKSEKPKKEQAKPELKEKPKLEVKEDKK